MFYWKGGIILRGLVFLSEDSDLWLVLDWTPSANEWSSFILDSLSCLYLLLEHLSGLKNSISSLGVPSWFYKLRLSDASLNPMFLLI